MENQLSPSLISLSPLVTNLPNIFPHARVQSSFNFNLFITRSLGFGSKLFNYSKQFNIPRFHFAYFLYKLSSLNSLTRWPIMQKVHWISLKSSSIAISYSILILFQFLAGGSLSTFLHSTLHYRLLVIFKLRRWSSSFQTKFYLYRSNFKKVNY